MNSSKRTILSVDDENTNQLIIKKLLADDFEILNAHSGDECLTV